MEKVEYFGNPPLPRFGHTATFISKGQAIIIGGAIGDTGKYSITCDTFSFDIATRWWKRVQTTGTSPSPRAAHAAVSVEKDQIVIYGGATGGGSLASDDLYLLDLRSTEETGIWTIVPIVGPTPGRRYGHTLTYSKPYLVVFGGNTGTEPINDCWTLNVEKSPFQWFQIESKGESPLARVYHSASLCSQGTANGMVVVFGGRSGDSAALNDAWGLRKHRDGRWDWVKAPKKLSDSELPLGRYQHSSVFLGSFLLIIGGRTNNVGETLNMEVYDTETSEWHKFNSVQRFRHGCWLSENFIYVYGGFDLESPNIPIDVITKINITQVFSAQENILQKALAFLGGKSSSSPSNVSPSYSPTLETSSSSFGSTMSDDKGSYSKNGAQETGQFSPMIPNNNQLNMPPPSSSGSNSGNQGGGSSLTGEKQFFFRNHQFAEELKPKDDQKKDYQMTLNMKGPSETNALHNIFLNTLLQPKNYINLPENVTFQFQAEHITALCDQAEAIIKEQPMVLRVRAPLKIFGDIHGQYSDLMRFFDLWGSPYQNGKDGDIQSFDYLFLGDFVDRGSHSLETICLLLALKVRFPEQVHLIRGNHEDKWINNGFGFSEQCANRLGEDPADEDSVFARVNRLFEWLPLATIIEDQIICLHGGIGSSLHYIEEIENLKRPLEVIHEVSTPEQQLVVDILWSDPTDSDLETGILPNVIRDPAGTGNIVKFGPDRVSKFLQNNNLSMIIRAHQCVMDGFERFAGGQLITIFSATDYCGRHKNAGAVLFLRQNLELIPKLIYPNVNNINNWIQDERPPTPPRWKNPLARKSFD